MLASALIEQTLGRSKDPRFRSVADSIRHLLVFALSLVPVGGPILVRVLQAAYVLPKAPEPATPEPVPPVA